MLSLTVGCQPIMTPLVAATPTRATPSQAPPVAEASDGAIAARLQPDGSLEIVRNGILYQLLTPVSEEGWERWQEFPLDLQLVDLDPTGETTDEPEVVLIVSTSGASCCTTLSVHYFSTTSGMYQRTEPRYRKYTLGFDLVDLDGDGVTEFRTLNEDFNYALGGATVVSFLSPLQILRYETGELHDVTRDFPALLRERQADWLADEETLCSIYGAGAYLAEAAMLGNYGVAEAEVTNRCELPADEWSVIEEALDEFGYLP